MASQLRTVLQYVETHTGPVSVERMAHELQIEAALLTGMLDYWVRKGRLREICLSGEGCPTCGIRGSCPFVTALPRAYTLVETQSPGGAASATGNGETASGFACPASFNPCLTPQAFLVEDLYE
ncbi:MAG: hypothetical protein H3C34_17930 [Caldilineaceae bacterium]|nr:hypothetical protein [Caldilineaceae bacterium]